MGGKTKTSFSDELQPSNRRPRGKGWRTLILEEFEKRNLTEGQFIEYILTRAMKESDPQSGKLLSEIISRLDPAPKATAPFVTFEFPSNGTMVEKVDAIIDATSSGQIPPDIAQVIVGMLKTRMDVEETTELAERIERIEAILAKNGA